MENKKIVNLMIIAVLLLAGVSIGATTYFSTGGWEIVDNVLRPTSDDVYDIGDSTHEARNLYIDGTATIDTLTVDVASTFTGGITTDTLTATGNVTMNDAGADNIFIGSATDTVRIYGILTLGDNGATGEVNTSDWDISPTGVMTGIGAITADGLITGTLGTTITGAAVNLNASSNFAVNVATGSSSGAVAIGGNSNTVAVNSSDWDISTVGAMTNIDSVANAGTLALSTSASGGDITLTTNDATGTVNILTGNLKVGNGTPGVTQDAEDAYIEGTLEVDGATTLDGAATIAGTTTLNGVATIGDNGDTVAINSSDWDINTTGDMTGIGALTMDGVFTQSLATANPFSVTSTLAGISTAVNIYNTNADVTGQQYLLDLKYTDDDDTDADFIRCIDDAGINADLLFDVDSAGAITTASNLAVNGGTISSTVDIIIDSAGGDIDIDAADLQIDASKKLSLNGATETDYVQSNTNVEIVAAADILLDPAGGDIDVDAADVQLDAGKKLSLNGATETDFIYSSTDVEVGAAADIVLSPTGGQVDMNTADVGLDAGKTLSLAGIAALTQASLIYQNSAIEVFVNTTNTYDFTAAGLVGQAAATLETGTGATKINGDFQINDGANKPIGDVTFSNANDNVTITNTLIDAGSRIFLQAAGVTVGDIYCNTPVSGSVLVGSNTNETADFTVWYEIIND